MRAAIPAGLAVLDEGGEGGETNEELRRLYHTDADEHADTDPKAAAAPTPEPEAARFSVDYSRGEVLLESSDDSDNGDDEGQESVRIRSLFTALSPSLPCASPLKPPTRPHTDTGYIFTSRQTTYIRGMAPLLLERARPTTSPCASRGAPSSRARAVFSRSLTLALLDWLLWPALGGCLSPCRRTRT